MDKMKKILIVKVIRQPSAYLEEFFGKTSYPLSSYFGIGEAGGNNALAPIAKVKTSSTN